MFNLDLTYDIIDAANAHEDFDKANIRDLADLYDVSEQYVAERIEYTREQIKAKKDAQKAHEEFKKEINKFI